MQTFQSFHVACVFTKFNIVTVREHSTLNGFLIVVSFC